MYVFRVAEVDLSISKTDGLTQARPGQALTYTIVISNRGPEPVEGAGVRDIFPAALTGVTWRCATFSFAGCGAPTGTGHMSTTVNLSPIGRVVFTATGVVSAGARGTLVNTVTVAAPGGSIELDATDNRAVDRDALLGGVYLPIVRR